MYNRLVYSRFLVGLGALVVILAVIRPAAAQYTATVPKPVQEKGIVYYDINAESGDILTGKEVSLRWTPTFKAAAQGNPPQSATKSESLNVGDTEKLFAKIDQVRRIADKIVIDGSGGDWKGIPIYEAPVKKTGIDPTRHIVRMAIAPRENDLLVALQTEGAPSPDTAAFGVRLDLMGLMTDDIEIPLGQDGAPSLWVFQGGQKPASVPVTGIEVAVGSIVEIRIPYASLAQALPAEMARQLTGPSARSWVRVSSYSWNIHTRQSVDQGPSVASYRLTTRRYSPDSVLPLEGKTARAIPMPLHGQWLVGQGAYQGPFGVGDHKDHWAYDIEKRDTALSPSSPLNSSENKDFYAFGQPIFAPLAGHVLERRGEAADHAAHLSNVEGLPSNFVFLDLGDGQSLAFVHCQQGSVSVQKGQAIPVGQQIAAVGDSGPSGWAHLHLTRMQGQDLNRSLPLAFSHVRISLNPVPNDFWARDLDVWDLQEGFFVEPLP